MGVSVDNQELNLQQQKKEEGADPNPLADSFRRKSDIKCLVTGAGGFVGAALVRQLVREGYKVRALLLSRETVFNLDKVEVELFVGNVLDKTAVREAVQNVDFVFHSAALYDGIPFYDQTAKRMYEINVEGTRNICQAALDAQGKRVQRLIYTSTTGTVGLNEDGSPSNETIPLNHLDRRSHYEKSKAKAENVALSFHEKGLNVVSVNPSFIVGRGDHRPTPTGDMIIKYLNGSYPCYFDARVTLSNLEDVVGVHIACMTKGRSGQRYILASEPSLSVKELFDQVGKISGVRGPWLKLPLGVVMAMAVIQEALIGFLGLRGKVRPLIQYEMARYLTLGCSYSSTKAREELGFEASPLEESLRRSVEWYLRNGYIKNKSRLELIRNSLPNR